MRFALLGCLLLSLNCGPSAVALVDAKTCDGGNLEECHKRCEGDNLGRACYRLGWFYEEDRDVDGSVKRALEYYDKACNANFAVACRALGNLYWLGERVDRNRGTAIVYYRRACDLGLPEACPTDDMLRLASGKSTKPTGVDADAEGGFGFSVSVGEPDEPKGPKAPNAPSAPKAPEGEVPSPPSVGE